MEIRTQINIQVHKYNALCAKTENGRVRQNSIS